jgi:hypothetical protein
MNTFIFEMQAQAVCETFHDEVHYQIQNTDSAQVTPSEL